MWTEKRDRLVCALNYIYYAILRGLTVLEKLSSEFGFMLSLRFLQLYL